MNTRTYLIGLSFTLVSIACSSPAKPTANDLRPILDSLLHVHARHFLDGDIDALANSYSETAVVRPAGMDPVRGRQAIRTMLATWIAAAPVKSLAYTTEDLAVFGDTLFHVASYQMTAQPPGGALVSDRGSCTLLWVRLSANWEVDRSHCNSSMPPQQQVDRTGRTR